MEMENNAIKSQRLRMSEVMSETLKFLPSIGGYSKEPLVSIEDAVQPLVDFMPKIQKHACFAKQRCMKPADQLTSDESASIMLYTMGCEPSEESFFSVLNKTLRDRNRETSLKPWYPYLRLFLNALHRLPSLSKTVFRGVKGALGRRYVTGDTIVWWGFSSCSANIGVLQLDSFLGKRGARTLFTITCQTAKDIHKHSFYASEEEMLLMAATQFKVVSCLDQDDLQIIQLEETFPPYPLLEPINVINPELDTASPISLPSSPVPMIIPQLDIVQTTIPEPIQAAHTQPTTIMLPNIPTNAKWVQKGITIAGGYGPGKAIYQLHSPHGLCVVDDKTLVITDRQNHRVVQWTIGDINGKVIAGDHDFGKQLYQLYSPTDVLVDRVMNSLIICDRDNRRVVSWSCLAGTTTGEILVDNIRCWGLAMDDQRYLYLSDVENHEVRRYDLSSKTGVTVAGGHGAGDGAKQLNAPRYIFVDRQQNLYVADYNNHRVMKWCKDATEGIVVAGGQGKGSALSELWYPSGIFVDNLGTIYVADMFNHRIMRWSQKARTGTVILGGNGCGQEETQLNEPYGLTFDHHGNIYVADQDNHRVQKFFIE